MKNDNETKYSHYIYQCKHVSTFNENLKTVLIYHYDELFLSL